MTKRSADDACMVRGGELAGLHHLQAGVEPADAGRGALAAGILQRDDAAAGLLGADQIERLQHQRPHRLVAPDLRQRGRLRLPGLDRVGDRPERVALLPAELAVVAVELRRILDIGSTDDVLAHARLRSSSRQSDVALRRNRSTAGPATRCA